ncbi:MAG: HAD family hydrolase [Pseudomonadota bacterium]
MNNTLTDMLEGVELVVFDFDGVIADSEVISLQAMADALDDYGVQMDLDQVRHHYLGVSLATIIQDLTTSRPNIDWTDFPEFWEQMVFARLRSGLKPVFRVDALLDHLHASGTPFCIASSGSFQRIFLSLDTMNMRERFDHVFSADLVEHGKPAPDLFLHAAAQLGVAPDKCIVLEDSPKGVQGARAAGMRAVGFVGGRHLTGLEEAHGKVLRDAGANAVITSY